MDDERTYPEQPILIQPDDVDQDVVEDSDTDRRRIGIAVAIVVFVVVALVALLLMRGCSAGTLAGTEGEKTIEVVTDEEPNQGMVSVWLEPGTTARAALSGIPVKGVTNTGGGRLIVGVARGTEERVIARLKRRDGVYDAGFVYGDPSPAK